MTEEDDPLIDWETEARIAQKADLALAQALPLLPPAYRSLAEKHGYSVVLWKREGLSVAQIKKRIAELA